MILSVILLVDSGSLAMVLAARVIEGVSIGFLLLGYQVGAADPLNTLRLFDCRALGEKRRRAAG